MVLFNSGALCIRYLIYISEVDKIVETPMR